MDNNKKQIILTILVILGALIMAIGAYLCMRARNNIDRNTTGFPQEMQHQNSNIKSSDDLLKDYQAISNPCDGIEKVELLYINEDSTTSQIDIDFTSNIATIDMNEIQLSEEQVMNLRKNIFEYRSYLEKIGENNINSAEDVDGAALLYKYSEEYNSTYWVDSQDGELVLKEFSSSTSVPEGWNEFVGDVIAEIQ